jgi:DNA-binding transcriptional LysR family regulator
MKEPSQADLVRRRLMTTKMCFYAVQEYIDEHGAPETLEDLMNHRIISQNLSSRQVSESVAWLKPLLTKDHMSSLTVNNYFGVLQATLHGAGIGVLPDYVTQEVPDLVRVMPAEQSKDVPVYLAYPEELRQSKRVEAFRDFVLDEIREYRRAQRVEEGA